MMRPLPSRPRRAAVVALGLVLALASSRQVAQAQKAPAAEANVGQFFSAVEPITDEVKDRIENEVLPLIQRAARQGTQPILVFEFRPGDAQPGKSRFGACVELQRFLATRLGGAKQTIAYIPEPLTGFAVLPALACDEIVMGPQASIGPILAEGERITEAERGAVRALAESKGREPDLMLGLLDPDSDLREVRTADRQTHYVLASRLDEFKKTHTVVEDQAAWEGGRRGVLTAERARGGLVKLLADDRAKIAEVYGLPSTSDDPTLGGPVNPVLIRIDKEISQVEESYLSRRIAQAKQEKANLIIFDIDSAGGLDHPAANIADAIANLKGIKTVAYIDDRATGVTTLVALACDEIVFRKGARMGELTQVRDGNNAQDLSPEMLRALADRAQSLAKQKGHPPAVARAMVDPGVALHSARDAKTGSVAFVTDEDIDKEPGRYQIQDTPKPANQVLTLTADNAQAFGMAAKRSVEGLEGLKAHYGLAGKALRVDGPTWVDSLVTLLNTPLMSWLLLFVGMFMLILELKLPGVGLPAITSALAFLLFFWSHYLGGTADKLEILLFLVGLVCLALELFVFPGFGVFGMSGILLILASVIMASHTFIWPTQDYEYRQMGRTLLQVTIAIVAVSAGAVVLGRYFPSLPLFNRMVLQPESADADLLDPDGKPPLDPDAPLFYLIGEIGTTTTALKPTGKARFGELLVDVTADGFYIDAGTPVEVIEVRGARVLVKRV
jgi:membrane-bound serine protease (ClpP class)